MNSILEYMPIGIIVIVLGCACYACYYYLTEEYMHSGTAEVMVSKAAAERGLKLKSVDCFTCSHNSCDCQVFANGRLYEITCLKEQDYCQAFKLSE